MWIAWINMELILGDLKGVVVKAIEADVSLKVYSKILEVVTGQEDWEVAISFGRKMLKKFNKEY